MDEIINRFKLISKNLPPDAPLSLIEKIEKDKKLTKSKIKKIYRNWKCKEHLKYFLEKIILPVIIGSISAFFSSIIFWILINLY